MKKKIKLIIFPGYFLPHIGGLETHVDEFSKYLSRNKNYQITIFVPRIPCNAKEKEIIHNKVKVIRYPAFEIVSNYPFPKMWSLKFWNLYFNLYKKDFNIVMTRTRFFSNSFLGLIFAKFRLNRKKLVHIEHGSEFVKLESKVKSFLSYSYDQFFGRLIFVLADKNVAISKTVYNFMKKNFLKKKTISIIKRGVDFEIYDNLNEDKNIKKKFKGKVIMTFLGRLYKWKGVENSIKAYLSLPVDLKEKSVFLIVGYGEDEKRLKKFSGKYLNNGIHFLGKKSFEQSIKILKSTDIYIHSAYKGGGLSNSLLQAMYCSCSIIASPHEGAKEVINNNNGILLKNNSENEIRDGIVKLVEKKNLRNQLSGEAKKYIKNNFSWKKVIKDYEKIFSEVLK